MTEKPTFCPVCKRMQVGVHGKDHALRKAATQRELQEPVHPEPAPRIEIAREAQAKFDKTAYQRDYMKKWRLARKIKP